MVIKFNQPVVAEHDGSSAGLSESELQDTGIQNMQRTKAQRQPLVEWSSAVKTNYMKGLELLRSFPDIEPEESSSSENQHQFMRGVSLLDRLTVHTEISEREAYRQLFSTVKETLETYLSRAPYDPVDLDRLERKIRGRDWRKASIRDFKGLQMELVMLIAQQNRHNLPAYQSGTAADSGSTTTTEQRVGRQHDISIAPEGTEQVEAGARPVPIQIKHYVPSEPTTQSGRVLGPGQVMVQPHSKPKEEDIITARSQEKKGGPNLRQEYIKQHRTAATVARERKRARDHELVDYQNQLMLGEEKRKRHLQAARMGIAVNLNPSMAYTAQERAEQQHIVHSPAPDWGPVWVEARERLDRLALMKEDYNIQLELLTQQNERRLQAARAGIAAVGGQGDTTQAQRFRDGHSEKRV